MGVGSTRVHAQHNRTRRRRQHGGWAWWPKASLGLVLALGFAFTAYTGGMHHLPPHPWLNSPRRAGQLLDTASPEEQFAQAFTYGGWCGKWLDLTAIADREAAVPASLRTTYLDGVSHGLALDEANTNAQWRQLAEHFPPEARNILLRGLVRAYAEAHTEDPDGVWAFAHAGRPPLPEADILDGIRTGIQRANGGQMGAALQAIPLWPPAIQRALAEELGWRIGDDSTPATLVPLLAAVPPAQACALVRGAVRGAALRAPTAAGAWPAFGDWWRAAPPDCADELDQGLAWALHIRLGPRARDALPSIADDTRRARVASWLDALQQQHILQPVWAPIVAKPV